jgi:hypothetical protein
MTNTILQRKRDEIRAIYAELSSAKNVKPSKRINAIFSKLVGIVQDASDAHSKAILNDPQIRLVHDNLRKISSIAESELELFWAKKILISPNAERTLRDFPYYDNYNRMIQIEIDTMLRGGVPLREKVLFVGPGPLPLSSILMAKNHAISLDNLDKDDDAYDISRKLIERVGLSDTVRTIKGNILEMNDFSEYKVIFIAALVGEDEKGKGEIISHVVSKIGEDVSLVMRNVDNLGVLLYPEVTESHLKEIEVLRRSISPKDIINTIIIGKKKSYEPLTIAKDKRKARTAFASV